MEINAVTRVTDEVADGVGRLIRQLAPGSTVPTRETLSEIVASPGSRLLVARETDSGEILGTATVATYRIPTGLRAWVEDVVVDEAARGRGVGEALVRRALMCARELGAQQVDLTSHPDRAAANRLYQRLGFERRTTNAYRYRFRFLP